MNYNLIKTELKRDTKIFLIVTLSLTGFFCITLSMYSVMKESMMDIASLYSSMSPAIMKAINFSDGQWNHVLGFYSTYFGYYIPLMAGAYSIFLGVSILSREEQNKTAEFLLAKPISRKEVISSKLSVLIFFIFLLNLTVWLNGVLWTGFISGFKETFVQISILHTYGLFICIFFGVLGFFITVLMKRAKAIIGPAIGIVMFMFMFDMIIRITDKAQFLLYLTPYKYMNVNVMPEDYNMEWWRPGVMAAASVALILLSYLFYKKKDILI